MIDWRTIQKIISGTKATSTCYKGNAIAVKCSDSFKDFPMSRQREINDIIENEQKNTLISYFGRDRLSSLADVQEKSARLVPLVINNYKTDRLLTATVQDAIMNMPAMANVRGQDPATQNLAIQNVWISPQEAAAVYSQKGLPETIINKKGKSPLLNGVRIKNPKLSPEQMDIVQDNMDVSGLPDKIVEGLLVSLIYGGGLLFPMFKKDTPLSLHLPVDTLLKYGILDKDSVDRWVTLDRWNCVHIPNWNPTAEDFLFPKHYYIPFLGAHIAGQRCARIITAKQIGYWAVLMTLGWGISDIPGWIESAYNYYNVMSAIPTMINQMSIVVRTLNVDSYLATEGYDMLNDINLENTARMREASPNNMIHMDVIGDLKALQRDFAEVPNLVRLIRQDLGGRANIPEELLFSSEKGAFASGDPTASAQEKQWESIKALHREVSKQLKNVAMIQVVNALGTGQGILKNLKYTTFEFDNPVVTNPETRGKIGTFLSEAFFDFVAGGVPRDAAMHIIQKFGDETFNAESSLLASLKEYQERADRREARKHELEMELLEAQIGQTRMGIVTGGAAKGIKNPLKKDKGYTKMEQHQKETSRGTSARMEGMQRAQGKII